MPKFHCVIVESTELPRYLEQSTEKPRVIPKVAIEFFNGESVPIVHSADCDLSKIQTDMTIPHRDGGTVTLYGVWTTPRDLLRWKTQDRGQIYECNIGAPPVINISPSGSEHG